MDGASVMIHLKCSAIPLNLQAMQTYLDLLRDVLALRPLYFATAARLEREVNPLVKRKSRAAQTSERRIRMQYV